MLLASLLVVACDKGGDENVKPTLKITSESTIELGVEGGTAEITYTVANGASTTVNIYETTSWLDTTVEPSKVIVTVDANDGMSPREAKITIKYYDASEEIIVKQAGKSSGDYDVEFVGKRFEGIYYEPTGSSMANYYVIISDRGVAMDGTPKAGGTYYFFDMYSATAAEDGYPLLPEGNYSYDTTNSYADLTFSEELSWYAVMGANGEYSKTDGFTSASVSVTKNRFEAVIELASGEKHHVVYEGELLTAVGYIYSTFTEDVEFAVEDATISANLYGDILEIGQQNWYIEAVKGSDLFMIEVFTPSTTSFDGIYQMLDPEAQDYTNRFIPGMIGEDGLVGTWYAKVTDGSIKGDVMAPMGDGIIRLTTSGNTLTIEYGCKDDAGNNITGKVSGALTINDMRE